MRWRWVPLELLLVVFHLLGQLNAVRLILITASCLTTVPPTALVTASVPPIVASTAIMDSITVISTSLRRSTVPIVTVVVVARYSTNFVVFSVRIPVVHPVIIFTSIVSIGIASVATRIAATTIVVILRIIGTIPITVPPSLLLLLPSSRHVRKIGETKNYLSRLPLSEEASLRYNMDEKQRYGAFWDPITGPLTPRRYRKDFTDHIGCVPLVNMCSVFYCVRFEGSAHPVPLLSQVLWGPFSFYRRSHVHCG